MAFYSLGFKWKLNNSTKSLRVRYAPVLLYSESTEYSTSPKGLWIYEHCEEQ